MVNIEVRYFSSDKQIFIYLSFNINNVTLKDLDLIISFFFLIQKAKWVGFFKMHKLYNAIILYSFSKRMFISSIEWLSDPMKIIGHYLFMFRVLFKYVGVCKKSAVW